MLLPTVLGLGPLAIFLVGYFLIWWVNRWQWQPGIGPSPLGQGLRAFGCFLMAAGVLTALTVMTHVFAVVAWLFLLVLLIALIYRYRDARRQSLIWVLTTAAERGISLETAVRAFANEHTGRSSASLHKLADYLEAGLPLSLAMQRAGLRLPVPTALAADMGQWSGSLGSALRQAAIHGQEFDNSSRTVTHWLLYLAMVVCWSLTVVTFLAFKILPVFRKMFSDFAIELPAATRTLIELSEFADSAGPLLLLAALAGIALVLLTVLNYVGVPLRTLPVLRRLWWRADCALVMHWLAEAARRGRPIAEMVRLLSVYFPQPQMRVRLERANRRLESGADWCETLHQQGLFRRTERRVFKAAERVGNLPWALEEMAASSLRRSVRRVQAAVDVAFPILLLLLGGAVLLIASGILLPLATLIQSLS